MVAFRNRRYSLLEHTRNDPTAMLRTYLRIAQVACRSLHGIPDFLAGNPLYAASCGLDPELILTPQTFRGCRDRLAAPHRSFQSRRLCRSKKSPKQRTDKSRHSRLEQFLQHLTKGKPIPLVTIFEILKDLLAGFAHPSIRFGYLRDPRNKRVADDGTPIQIHANESGKRPGREVRGSRHPLPTAPKSRHGHPTL